MESILSIMNEIARPILLIIASIFTIVIALNKFGRKVIVSYSIVSEGFSSTRISNIVLQNKKDKPISVFSINGVFENDVWLELDKFNPPKILKPNEAIGIKTPEYSRTVIGSDVYTPNFNGLVDIYIETEKDYLKCKKRRKTNKLGTHTMACSESSKFGGFVFDESVSYILNYYFNEKSSVAFIHSSGYIGNEWEFGINHIGSEATEQSIKDFLSRNGFDKMLKNYICYKVSYPMTNFVFRKQQEKA